jgi:oxalate decarboxylase
LRGHRELTPIKLDNSSNIFTVGSGHNAPVGAALLARAGNNVLTMLRIPRGGELRIVSQKEFPIQNTLTGATVLLKPGALREMHWHPNADEWQFYLSGRARITIFGAHGRTKTEEFGPGEVAFIKQGFGHFVEQIGDEPTKALTLFKSPVFQEISISTWLAASPLGIITDNFGISPELADKLPRKRIVIAAPKVGSSSST